MAYNLRLARRINISVLVILFLATAFGPSLINAATGAVGKVVGVDGKAWRAKSLDALEAGGTPLSAGGDVFAGDYLRSGQGTTLRLVFGACRTQLTLGAETTLQVSGRVGLLRHSWHLWLSRG